MGSGTGGDHRSREASDDAQGAALTVGTAAVESGELLCRQQRCDFRFCAVQVLPTERQGAAAVAVGEQAEVTDFDKPGRQHMQQEPAKKLNRSEAHNPDAIVVPGVAPAKAHLAIRKTQQSTIGNGNTMSVTSQILENVRGAAKRRVGMNHPCLAPQLR